MAYSNPSYASCKRTVHCSYCGGRGHNRAGCSQFKARIEKRRAEHGDDDYTVRCYDQKKQRKAAKAKTRKCSYCDSVGHNRATCLQLKAHMDETKASNAVFRKRLNDCFAGIGFGIGAIVLSGRETDVLDDGTEEKWKIPQVVTQINWCALNHWNDNYSYFDAATAPYFSKNIGKLAATTHNKGSWMKDRDVMTLVLGNDQTELFLSEEQNWRSKDVDYYFVQIESQVPATEPPCAWLDGGADIIKRIYKDRQSWQGAI